MFDPSAPHIIILLVVVLLLFGSKRLPGAAKSMGQAMKNFKSEMKSMHDDDDEKPAEAAPTVTPSALAPPAAQPVAQPSATSDVTAQQLSDLQRQIEDLQVRQNVGTGAAPVSGAPRSEAQPNQQPF
jgi:sec-independent protein translocase protein TatA